MASSCQVVKFLKEKKFLKKKNKRKNKYICMFLHFPSTQFDSQDSGRYESVAGDMCSKHQAVRMELISMRLL